jgi:hypothetical protein
MLSSVHNYEITKVNVYSDRYLIAYTQTTILLGDLGHKKKLISEVQYFCRFHQTYLCNSYNGQRLDRKSFTLTILEFACYLMLGS